MGAGVAGAAGGWRHWAVGELGTPRLGSEPLLSGPRTHRGHTRPLDTQDMLRGARPHLLRRRSHRDLPSGLRWHLPPRPHAPHRPVVSEVRHHHPRAPPRLARPLLLA